MIYNVMNIQSSKDSFNNQPGSRSQRKYKSKMLIWMMCGNISLGFFYFGYCLVYLGTLPIATVLSIFPTDISVGVAQGLLNGCMPIGASLGALISSFFLARLSRRKGLLLIACVGLVVGGLLYIPNFYSLLIFRLCQGCCVGIFSTLCSLTMKELAPTQISGSLGALLEVQLCIGSTLAYTLVYILKKTTGDLLCESFWWAIFAIPLLCLTLQIIVLTIIFPYETPKYLLLQGRQEDARELLKVIYLPEFVEQILQEKKQDIQHAFSQKIPSHEQQQSLLSIQGSSVNLKPKARAAAIIGAHLAVMQQFSGINAVNIYCNPIIAKATTGELTLLMSSIIQFEKLITVLISTVLLSRFGRKTILQIGMVIVGLATTSAALGFFIQDTHADTSQLLIIVGLFTFMGAFGLSLGPVIWIYVPEIIQPQVVPFTTAANWISNSSIVTLFPILTEHVLDGNPAPLFLFFAIWTFASIGFNHFFMIQTKDKSERKIREQYAQSKLYCGKQDAI